MAKILNYYSLCPINDVQEFLGLSKGAEPGTIINTLGKNIVLSVKLSNQKQLNSWTSLDKLSNKVVYDFKTQQYVGVFGNKWIRCWNHSSNDINKVKKIKLAKPIDDLITFENRGTIVLYNDGTCESLELAIDTRKDDRTNASGCHQAIVDPNTTKITKPSYFKTGNGKILMTYFTKSLKDDDIYFVCFKIDHESLQMYDGVRKFKIARDDQSSQLSGYAVVDGMTGPNVITIWTDKRIFLQSLREENNLSVSAPGHFAFMLNGINVGQPLSVIGISKNCIAIYGANSSPKEGGSLLLYNTQFNVIESRQDFKIYFNESRLWVEDKYLFFAYGQTLAVIQFRISREQLSDMVGSQRSMEQRNPIDTECINVDGELEDMLRFDVNAQERANGEAKETGNDQKQGVKPLEHIPLVAPKCWKRALEGEETFIQDLRDLYQYDIVVDTVRDPTLLPDMIQLQLSSNLMDSPFSVEAIQILTAELERSGVGEIEITEFLIPILIKANLTAELIVCLRKYTNISENVLVNALKYLLDEAKSDANKEGDPVTQNYLNVILSCSFNQDAIKKHLRLNLSFDDVLFLLNFIYEALKAEELQLEERPQYGDEFDDDVQLSKWFITIIDAHFHQFIMSQNPKLIELLTKWKELVDRYVTDLQGLKTLEAMVVNLVDGKAFREKQCSKWYSVEEVKLF